jgi:hypothetical protein
VGREAFLRLGFEGVKTEILIVKTEILIVKTEILIVKTELTQQLFCG